MVGYKLSKNDWVTPFFVIFRSFREKLLVTVSFDHPVANAGKNIKNSTGRKFTRRDSKEAIIRYWHQNREK